MLLTEQPESCTDAPAVQGRPLLASKSAASDARGYVCLPLVNGTAQLPDLSVTGVWLTSLRMRGLLLWSTQGAPCALR